MRLKLSLENLEFAAEWDYEKNKGLKPDDFTGGSDRKMWWKCKLGHCWEATIGSRFPNGSKCPYCTNRKAWFGFNDLQTLNPSLAADWDYENNYLLKPTEVTVGSERKVWWKCELGHKWEAVVFSRNRGSQCPYCTNLKAWPDFNDLKTTHPHIAAEWDDVKNKNLRPEHFLAGSGEKAWWKCRKCGHSWKAQIDSRKRRGCPCCAGLVLIPGVNDLRTVDPIIADRWDYIKNGELTPECIVASNKTKKIWWNCEKGHNWKATVQNRVLGKECPYCNRRTPMRIRLVK